MASEPLHKFVNGVYHHQAYTLTLSDEAPSEFRDYKFKPTLTKQYARYRKVCGVLEFKEDVDPKQMETLFEDAKLELQAYYLTFQAEEKFGKVVRKIERKKFKIDKKKFIEDRFVQMAEKTIRLLQLQQQKQLRVDGGPAIIDRGPKKEYKPRRDQMTTEVFLHMISLLRQQFENYGGASGSPLTTEAVSEIVDVYAPLLLKHLNQSTHSMLWEIFNELCAESVAKNVSETSGPHLIKVDIENGTVREELHFWAFTYEQFMVNIVGMIANIQFALLTSAEPSDELLNGEITGTITTSDGPMVIEVDDDDTPVQLLTHQATPALEYFPDQK